MAVLVSQVHDAYLDGLGKSSQLGVFFLRRVNINLNGAATSYTLTLADMAVQKYVRVVSIVPLSADTEYVSAVGSVGESVTITATSNTAVFDVFVLVQGQ